MTGTAPDAAVSLYALSIRQPWAGLIVAGRKRIEVRTWPANWRGPLLVHAAKTRDERPNAERHVTPDLAALCALAGGVIGRVELIECREYRTREAFAAEADRHLNAPDWFVPPVLYGLVFADPVSVPFFRCSGQTRFFTVSGVPEPRIIHPPEFPR
jgi:ASCH domain